MKLYKNIMLGLFILAIGVSYIAGAKPIALTAVSVGVAAYMWAKLTLGKQG